jgi:penicillin-binding protein 2
MSAPLSRKDDYRPRTVAHQWQALLFAVVPALLVSLGFCDSAAGNSSSSDLVASSEESSQSADPADKPTPSEPDGGTAAVDQMLDELATAPYAPVMTETGQRAYLFSIPAPRGLILDRHGLPLARNRTARYLALRLSQIDAIDEEAIVELVNTALDANPALSDVLVRPSARRIRSHWQHRRGLPLIVSAQLDEDLEKELEHSMGPAFSLETIYLRDYPQGELACHLIGHVSREDPQLDGPVVRGESLWPQVQGRSGMEQMYDEILRGSPGLVSELYAEDGTLLSRKMLRAPRPGLTFVISIDIGMQKVAEAILSRKARPGAMVTVDAENGQLLAVASWPQFNPADFVPSISDEKYKELTEDPNNPFFPRAFQGVYPPGSTFKPFVALAALEHGVVDRWSQVSGPPSIEVAGRTFHNWTNNHQGMLNVADAIARSSNTWFYQVGVATGDKAIIDSVSQFGFGRAPDIPVDGTSSGFLPANAPGGQAVANLSIGQGELLVSPLQMALAAAGIANGKNSPRARLVLQTQTAPPNERVVALQSPPPASALSFDEEHIEAVRDGMWSAVNTRSGTAGSAHMSWPEVSGKTGTAQWHAGKKTRNVAWFTGYVNAEKPKLAFAVAIEGKIGVSTAGGKHAAPLAGEFLKTIYDSPQRYAVTVPDRSDRTRIASGSQPRSVPRAQMVQISPDRSKLTVPANPPASPSAQPTARRSIFSRSSHDTPPASSHPPAPKRERGGFLSRLRNIFPSSD